MKALIKKRGAAVGRYYQGRTIRDIVRKFMRTKPNLQLIELEDYKNRYEIFAIDIKTDRWNFYEIPKDKIKR